MTIVIYRHYIRNKKGKDWGDLERFESPHVHSSSRHARASTSTSGSGVSRHGSGEYYQHGHIKRWDSRGSRSSTKSCPPLYTYPQQVSK